MIGNPTLFPANTIIMFEVAPKDYGRRRRDFFLEFAAHGFVRCFALLDTTAQGCPMRRKQQTGFVISQLNDQLPLLINQQGANAVANRNEISRQSSVLS